MENAACIVSYDPDDGRVLINVNGVIMIRKDGAWKRGIASVYQLIDFFQRITDREEVARLFEEARKVLESGFDRSLPDARWEEQRSDNFFGAAGAGITPWRITFDPAA